MSLGLAFVLGQLSIAIPILVGVVMLVGLRRADPKSEKLGPR